MIVIAGTLTLGIAVDDSVLDACRTMMTATHAEKGCVDYVFSADPLNDQTLRVFPFPSSAYATIPRGNGTVEYNWEKHPSLHRFRRCRNVI